MLPSCTLQTRYSSPISNTQNGKMVRYRNRENDTKMKQLQADMRDLLQQEEESKQELKALFKKLGYNLY